LLKASHLRLAFFIFRLIARGSYCQKSWTTAEAQAASFIPSMKITPAITSGSNTLPLSYRQWF
jgi:hypothetical protein